MKWDYYSNNRGGRSASSVEEYPEVWEIHRMMVDGKKEVLGHLPKSIHCTKYVQYEDKYKFQLGYSFSLRSVPTNRLKFLTEF